MESLLGNWQYILAIIVKNNGSERWGHKEKGKQPKPRHFDTF